MGHHQLRLEILVELVIALEQLWSQRGLDQSWGWGLLLRRRLNRRHFLTPLLQSRFLLLLLKLLLFCGVIGGGFFADKGLVDEFEF